MQNESDACIIYSCTQSCGQRMTFDATPNLFEAFLSCLNYASAGEALYHRCWRLPACPLTRRSTALRLSVTASAPWPPSTPTAGVCGAGDAADYTARYPEFANILVLVSKQGNQLADRLKSRPICLAPAARDADQG